MGSASIVVNNYNYGQFLRQAIDSALQQTYPGTEVLVVDDGSTDDSREIIASYGDRITPVLKQNGGQASAFNTGFCASSGDLVIFLDADDVLLPGAVAHAAEAFRDDEVVKVHWPLLEIDEHGFKSGQWRGDSVLPDGDFRSRLIETGPRVFSTHPTSGNAWSRRLLERLLPMPEEEFRISADFYLFTMAFAAGTVRSLPQAEGYWRKHGSNRYHATPFLERAEADLRRHEEVATLLAAFFREQGIDPDIAKWKATNGIYKRLLRLNSTAQQLACAIPQGAGFVLVDNRNWNLGAPTEVLTGRVAVPLGPQETAELNRANGESEIERLRAGGGLFIAFAWPAVGAFRKNSRLNDYLSARYRQIVNEPDLVVFDLRAADGAAPSAGPVTHGSGAPQAEGRNRSLAAIPGTGETSALIARNIEALSAQVSALGERIEELKQVFAYSCLIDRIRHRIAAALPPDARVIVASKGDDALVDLPCEAWHFPQTEDGAYSGTNPEDSAEAISSLEALRARGGEYLLLPNTALWWLEYYENFRAHLEEHHELVWSDDDAIVYHLLEANDDQR